MYSKEYVKCQLQQTTSILYILQCCQYFVKQVQKAIERPTKYESTELELTESIPERIDNLGTDYSLKV